MLPPPLHQRLRSLLGDGAFLTDPADCLAYGYDNSRRQGRPAAVALPTDSSQVLELVRACRDAGVAITARGRGTATTGAAVPDEGSLVVSFERMDGLLRIEPDDRLAVVQPGLLNGDLQQAAAAHGFFWAPDPTSAPYCTVGGNLACNAGGPRAVKYGAARDNVLALAAVSGRGEAFRCGAATTKSAIGYDLTRFLVGSEGTLALITEATLRLLPLPEARTGLRALYADTAAAAAAVARIMAQPVTPSALEFMDAAALKLARDVGGADIGAGGALLMIEVDGRHDALGDAAAAVSKAAEGQGLIELAASDDLDTLWQARRRLSPALRTLAPGKINEDVVVPVSRLPALIAGLEALSTRHGIPIVNFGHAGNGNIHVNLLHQPDDPRHAEAAPRCLAEVFELVLELGGTLSGEHGIGIDKRDFLARALDAECLALLHGVKAVFDPDGILNPGKLLPLSGLGTRDSGLGSAGN
ncbi:MAG TPA: FAD-linked oxidase C-terminal domain-containing protein [Xanthomonadaceae bacterium]|nr:FAD-linked oxidase C-terminal domain-containing protein [Xanthomonadaceae bacterium]